MTRRQKGIKLQVQPPFSQVGLPTPFFFRLRVYDHPKGTTVFEMMADFQGDVTNKKNLQSAHRTELVSAIYRLTKGSNSMKVM